MRCVALVAVLLVAVPPTVTAEVKLAKGPEGRWVVSGVGRLQRPQAAPAPRPGRQLGPKALDRLIDEAAARQRLDAGLVRAVVEVESDYNPYAVSRKGAMGLMQLMPETAALLAVRDPWDPAENLRGGTAYLRQLLNRFRGSLSLALAAYNAGPTTVDRYGDVPPYPETRSYVRQVLRRYQGDGGLPGWKENKRAKTYVIQGSSERQLITNQRRRSR